MALYAVLLFLLMVVVVMVVPATADVTCGPTGAFSLTGSSSVADIAKAWSTNYTAACGNIITVTSAGSTAEGGSIAGAQQVCGVGGNTVDIGLLNRRLVSPTEAIRKPRHYLYTCAKGLARRQLTEVQVAIDGLAFVAAPNEVAAKCLASLDGGGLTLSQVRWIYSGFSLAQLKSDPLFDSIAVPGSDGNDNTHKWSELCSNATCDCTATEISFAGSPTASGTFAFFNEKILIGNGETVRSGYQSDPNDSSNYVLNLVTSPSNSATIGFTSFVPYNKNANKVYAAAVQNPNDFVWRFPTFAEFKTGEYPVSFFLYMAVSNAILPVARAWFVYGYGPQGTQAIIDTGLLPITDVSVVQMLTRLGAPGGVNASVIYCGPGGTISQGGSSTAYPLAFLWGNVYGDACGNSVTTISGGSTLGAKLACGVANPISANIGTLSRPFSASEANILPNGNDYKCLIGVKRAVRQFPVAIDGIAFAFPFNGDAAACVATLQGKGLTVGQLRWIYSSYTIAQLTANGWKLNALGESDGSDSTHLWSELGGSGCAAKEIVIAGPPSSSETYSFFVGATFSGSGETIALNRPTPYYNVPEDNPNKVVAYLQATPASIGFFSFPFFDKNRATLGVTPVKNTTGAYVIPSEATLGDGSYSPYARQVCMELNLVFLIFQTAVNYVKFGITTTVGDTLTRAAGLTPISATTKATLTPWYVLSDCFSEISTVQVLNKGVVAMKDIKIGDMVMNAEGKYDAVYSFGHNSSDVVAEFVQIHASGLVSPLELTEKHMLFVEGFAVPASAVVVGDKLNLVNGGVAQVKKIQTVVRHGIYAPFTTSGTIAVNNVAASAYIDLQNKAGVLIVGGYKTPLSMQFLAHMFQAPHRLVCRINPAYCETETYNGDGVSAWVTGPFAVAEWFIQQNAVIMTLVFVFCFLLGGAIYLVELVTGSTVLLLVVATVSIYAVRYTKQAKKDV